MKHTLYTCLMSRKNQIIFSGEAGEDFLKFFKDTNDLVFNEKQGLL